MYYVYDLRYRIIGRLRTCIIRYLDDRNKTVIIIRQQSFEPPCAVNCRRAFLPPGDELDRIAEQGARLGPY